MCPDINAIPYDGNDTVDELIRSLIDDCILDEPSPTRNASVNALARIERTAAELARLLSQGELPSRGCYASLASMALVLPWTNQPSHRKWFSTRNKELKLITSWRKAKLLALNAFLACPTLTDDELTAVLVRLLQERGKSPFEDVVRLFTQFAAHPRLTPELLASWFALSNKQPGHANAVQGASIIREQITVAGNILRSP